MPIRRATPVDALYADLAEYDLVIAPDAPLASAIDRRLDRPHFGTFATTPRRLVAGRREQAEDRLAFLELVEETDPDWKAIAYAVGNVLQCWEHRGSLEAIPEYDAYVDDATREVVERLRTLPTTSKRLSEYEIDGDRSVAVVGDWKQSVYSFQYADVRNILAFEERLARFTADLDRDADRVSFGAVDPTRIELRENYRSTPRSTTWSNSRRTPPSTTRSSRASPTRTNTRPSSRSSKTPSATTTTRSRARTANRAPPEHGDVAVLTRTRDYGRELLDVAAEYDFPMAYDGGIELFRTDPAKLLLAWLRIAESEYRKQLSVYYHVLDDWFGEKPVEASLFYTADGRRERIDPLTPDEPRSLVRSAEAADD